MPIEYIDYYSILGVTKDASQKDIQTAFRRLARKHHPDVNKDQGSEAKFKKINEAYEVLKDPEKRQKYDQLGPNWEREAARASQGYGGFGGFGGQGAAQFEGGDFSDFFESIFGNAAFRNGDNLGFSGFNRARQHPAKDIHAEIEISLSEVMLGGTKKIQLSDPEGGTSRSLEFKIPRGVKDGAKIRLKGQGEAEAGGQGQKGDLILKILFEKSNKFYAIDHDLYMQTAVSPWQAILGDKSSLDIINGKVNINIPAGLQSGQKLRLKGKGLPKKDGFGDLFVIVNVSTPKVISNEQRALIEQLFAMDKSK